MGNLNIPFTDYTGEESTATLPVGDAIADVDITAVFDAVDGVSLGNAGQSQHVISANKDVGPGGNASSAFAQREMKWLCRYQDAVTLKKHRLEIPCADANLLAGNTDFLDLTAGAGLAFKTAFDAQVKSNLTGNAVVLNTAELVGRNL